MKPEIVIAKEPLYTGQVLSLERQTVRLGDGSTAKREVVHSPGAAGVLALDHKRALFVRQWRAPLGQFTLELPAGRIEPQEQPLATAQRELNEEAGFEAAAWRELLQFYQSVGFSDARCTLFLATQLTPLTAKRPLDDGEEVKTMWLTLEAAQQEQDAGTICDAKTMMGLLLWAQVAALDEAR